MLTVLLAFADVESVATPPDISIGRKDKEDQRGPVGSPMQQYRRKPICQNSSVIWMLQKLDGFGREARSGLDEIYQIRSKVRANRRRGRKQERTEHEARKSGD